MVDNDKLSADQRAAIVGIKETITEKGHVTVEYRFDKLGALSQLSKALGMSKQRVEHSGPQGGPIQMGDAKSRLFVLLGLPADAAQQPAPMAEIQPPACRICCGSMAIRGKLVELLLRLTVRHKDWEASFRFYKAEQDAAALPRMAASMPLTGRSVQAVLSQPGRQATRRAWSCTSCRRRSQRL